MKFKRPNINKPSRPVLMAFFIAILVGFLLSAQFFSTNKVKELTAPDVQESLALEVSILAESNDKLREEIQELQAQQVEYDEVLEYRVSSSEVLEDSLATYRLVSGLEEVSGAGATVTINGPVLDVHLLDLVNTLRNIGVDGIALNNQRVIYKSTILPDGLQVKLDDELITPPYRFQAVSTDPDLLVSSLEREGGLLDQLIKTFPEVDVEINKKDNLTLPAYRGDINFQYAKVADD